MAVPVPATPGPRGPLPFAYTLQVPYDSRAVGVARSSLRAALVAHGVPELVDRAQLLVSELVTNAIVHSRCEAEVRLTWADRTLRISVRDVGTEPPACRQLDPESESGRGLQLLHALADRWDHFSVRSGNPEALTKIIWCELDQNPPL